MKYAFLIVTVLLSSCKIIQMESLSIPVFPGAVGYGTETVAGRGGKIHFVTNLNDYGMGSLRSALEAKGPRTIVFEVGGVIKINSPIIIRYPFVTVAGQTAPSPGITIYGNRLSIYTSDVLVQHIRIRPGTPPPGADCENWDGIQITSSEEFISRRIVFDHISVSWGVDETFQIWGEGRIDKGIGPYDITISNSIIANSLADTCHPKGAHSMGLIIGDFAKRIAILENLFANNNDRNPLLKSGVEAVVANNLIYNAPNCSGIGSLIVDYPSPVFASFVGNHYISGPDTKSTARLRLIGNRGGAWRQGTELYIENNLITGTSPLIDTTGFFSDKVKLVNTFPDIFSGFEPIPVEQVQEHVLRYAGARSVDPFQDPTDTKVIENVRRGTGSILTTDSYEEDIASIPSTSHTLNLPDDPDGDSDNDGYTNLEEWLHELSLVVENK